MANLLMKQEATLASEEKGFCLKWLLVTPQNVKTTIMAFGAGRWLFLNVAAAIRANTHHLFTGAKTTLIKVSTSTNMLLVSVYVTQTNKVRFNKTKRSGSPYFLSWTEVM